jgi:hypothetical protein
MLSGATTAQTCGEGARWITRASHGRAEGRLAFPRNRAWASQTAAMTADDFKPLVESEEFDPESTIGDTIQIVPAPPPAAHR